MFHADADAQEDVSLKDLNALIAAPTSNLAAGQICGRVFKNGELVFRLLNKYLKPLYEN